VNLIQGTVDVMILKVVSRNPHHGFGISKAIRDRSDGILGLEDAALYQALHRMEKRGLLESQWGLSENNRRAKYYQITAEGKQRLKSQTAAWKRYSVAVSQVLELV
jgi:PadR family transcriptional regulator PadR